METVTRIFGTIIPTFFTTSGGISQSEISRIQAENKQQNDTFWSLMSDAGANIFRKVLTFLGNTEVPKTLSGSTVGPEDIRKEYPDIARRNAQTGVLMHGLKLHQRLLAALEHMDLTPFVTETMPEAPAHVAHAKRGTTCGTSAFMEMTNVDEMIANLNDAVLAQFNFAFFKRANELNSKAAAIGKIISEDKAFFRELLKPLPKGSEQITQNGVLITQWERQYSDEELDLFEHLREELRAEYDDLQRQLNGCRKQIKDAVRAFNLEQEREYQTRYGSYKSEAERYDREMEHVRSAAETLRQEAFAELAGLRVRAEE